MLAIVLLGWQEGDARVQGTVLDPLGLPLAGARVEIQRGERVRATYADGAGRFVLSGLPPGRCTLRVVVPRLPPVVDVIGLMPASRLERRIRLPMPELARVRVRVRVKAPNFNTTRPDTTVHDIEFLSSPCCWMMERR
jgi:hypothetical protein